MAFFSKSFAASLALAATTNAANTGTTQDVVHVVLFMQENRAFDHYFGTMAGVRGFKDPNVHVNNGVSVWHQPVGSLTNRAKDLSLWYLNYLGGDFNAATQCMSAGSNRWSASHATLNGDLNNNWPVDNIPWSWGHFVHKDIPNHFAVAEGWTIGDITINAPGSPYSPSDGGIYIDNNETPGCKSPNLNCYPLEWKTTADYIQDTGVSWQVYQDTDNFDDNPFAWFDQFQKAAKTSEFSKKGLAFNGLKQFYTDTAAGTLPQVSYIIGPAELSEHQPYQPKDGAWLQQKIVEVVTQSPL